MTKKNKKPRHGQVRKGFPDPSIRAARTPNTNGTLTQGSDAMQSLPAVASNDGLESCDTAELLELARNASIEQTEIPLTYSPMPIETNLPIDVPLAAELPAIPVNASREELIAAIRDMRRSKSLLDDSRRQLEQSRETCDGSQRQYLERFRALDSRETILQQAEATLAGRESSAETRHLQLVAQEAQAEEGFPTRLVEWRTTEERKQTELRAGLAADRTALDADAKEIDDKRTTVQQEKRTLDTDRAKVDAQQELMSDRINIEQKRAEELAQLKSSHLQEALDTQRLQIDRLTGQLTKERGTVDDLKQRLQQAGGLSMGDLIAGRERLQGEVEKLELELSSKPGHAAVEEYKRESARAKTLDSEILRLQSQLNQANASLARTVIPVTELENSRIMVRSLELQYQQLKEANAILQTDVEGKLSQAADRQAFPEMSRMEKDPQLQSSPSQLTSQFNLAQVIELARNRMASRRAPLYYDAETVRCFLGGLAMSRLHILQGISGTGKTSLPNAFAEALGGRADKIPVQAGWRDRQDLVGYYNAFDKRYHETEFVKSLYRSQCPQWSDRLCLIILDEMNLSYIEQFGADLLAELESPHRDGPQLALIDSKPANPPTLLRDGTAIALPPNVWFIGTANRDETTKDFADKSYDRAHTMELPRHPSAFTVGATAIGGAISSEALSALFENAKVKHKAQAEQACAFVASLESSLKDDFDIGWGNRLERQIRDFVPVIVASGGTLAEAIDHLVATKLLRKLEHRHNVRATDLKKLRTLLVEKAKTVQSVCLKKCDAKLAGLIRDRSFEEGEART